MENDRVFQNCDDLPCRGRCDAMKSYFVDFNTGLKDGFGEHWFVVLFNLMNENRLYGFNSYGIVNTVTAFGGKELMKRSSDNDEGEDDDDDDDERKDKKRRVSILLNLCEHIWGERKISDDDDVDDKKRVNETIENDNKIIVANDPQRPI